ncbi:MAG: hypothetical protein LBK82_16045 [Planctomycetaceae bacterium]|nr:hypothetical protein [Planctomycetaceae bacterium]
MLFSVLESMSSQSARPFSEGIAHPFYHLRYLSDPLGRIFIAMQNHIFCCY